MPDANPSVRNPVADWLPEFCSASVLFSLLVASALTLLVVQLAPGDASGWSLRRVPLGLLFVFAFSFIVVALLCLLRPRLALLPTSTAVIATYLVVLAGASVGSALSYWLDHALNLGATIAPGKLVPFVAGNVLVAAIVWGVALRHFYVRGQWQKQVRAHALAEFDALQARIRPHFLFNSMNTIASLVRDRPDDAERAIEDLSELFRVALRAGGTTTVGDELELVRRYVDIEKLRLGERLAFHEELSELPLSLSVPVLLLQPLVENAILHGVQNLEAGGRIEISARRGQDHVTITVCNPVAPRGFRLHRGSGTALHNIRQRLRHHFGDAARLEVETDAETHRVRLTLPIA